MSSIIIRGLTKRYDSVIAVDNIDLRVNEKDFIMLLGPSGCGKTTTLRCIAGLEQPDEGEIYIGDRMVFGPGVLVPTQQRRLGMVFQSYAIWPHMTVYENVAFPLRIQRVRKEEERQRTEQALQVVGMEDLGSRYPSQISGGQQQRVALARAVVANPSIILYDEPLSNLDAKLRDQMRFELRSLHNRLGITSVYVTHDQQEAMVLADRVCIMNRGKLVQTGTPREVYERPGNRFVTEFIGTANNIIEIAEARPKEGVVRLRSGLVVRVAGAVGEQASSELEGGVRMLVIRPHRIGIRRLKAAQVSNAGNNIFSGIVREAVYLGDRVQYQVEIALDCMLTVDKVSESDMPVVADRVDVELPPEDCVIV